MALNIVIIPKKRKEKTDLIAPGAVQITDQPPVVVNHTVENFKMSHYHWRNMSRPDTCPSAVCTIPRCAQRHPAGTVATSSPPRRGECEEAREKHQQKGTSTCPSASPAGTLSAVAIAPDTLNEQYVNDSGCTETQGTILAFKRKKKERSGRKELTACWPAAATPKRQRRRMRLSLLCASAFC